MKTNKVSRRQFQKSIAELSEEQLLMCIFINKLTDKKFTDKFARAHHISGKPPKFYKREMN